MPLKIKKPRKAVKKKAVKRRPAVKKKIIKKSLPKKKTTKKRIALPKKPKPEGKVVGAITHYFPHVRAAVIKLKAPLSVGDNIKIKGHTTDFTQNITSMQIDRAPITQAKKGDEIGLLVDSRVRQHDIVYKI